jgi:DNA-binding MarR family transcriptional regulator
MSPGETGPAAGSPDAADGEQPLAACGPGLGAGQGALRVLLAGDGLKSSDVAARGWSSPGTLTSVVNTLVREGYVERRRDPGDRRVVRLYVTDKGRQICQDYLMLAGPHWRSAFDFVNPADEPVIRRFFIDMISQFSELTRKERGR